MSNPSPYWPPPQPRGGPPPPAGYPPPGYPPHGPPSPPVRRRSLAWLWVSLAVVLVVVVGAAVALAVVRPWDDDSSGSPTADGTGGEAGGPSGGPSGGTTHAVPVTGDIDGDGDGDAVAVLQGDASEPSRRITLTSDGSSFSAQVEEIQGFEDRLWADLDVDGALDEVSWTSNTSRAVTVSTSAASHGNDLFELRDLLDGYEFVTMRTGDFDGDGDPDLAAYGQTAPEQVSVWVMRNNGAGFDDPQLWATLRNAKFAAVEMFAGDFTGDGLADVAVKAPAERVRLGEGTYTGSYGFVLLTSTGSSFDASELDGAAPGLEYATLVVGDFTGEGAPMVAAVGAEADGLEVTAYTWNGVAFSEQWVRSLGGAGERYVSAAAASDVDGDRIDDLVLVPFDLGTEQFDGFQVARSTGSDFGQSTTWAQTPGCDADFCFIYFQGGS